MTSSGGGNGSSSSSGGSSRLTRRVDGNDVEEQGGRVVRVDGVAGGLDGAPDEPGLAGDADGVQDEEGVVPQPVQRGGWLAPRRQRQREVRVPDHLGRAPRHQHRRVRRAGPGEPRELVRHPPHDRVPAEHLHEGREEGRAHDSCINKKVS